MINKSVNWILVILAYLSIFHMGLSDNMRGPLLFEMLKDQNLSDFQGSLFFSASSLFCVISAFSQQFFVPRIRPLYILKISLLLALAAQLLISYAKNFTTLLIGSVLLGLAFGTMGVLQNLMVLKSSGDQMKTRLLGGLHSLYAASSFVAPIMVSVVYAFSPGWRSSYMVAAGITVCFIFFYLMMSKSVPKSLAVKSEHTKAAKVSNQVAILFSVIVSSYVACEILISTRISLFVRREHEMSFEHASLYASVFFAAMLVGRVLLIFWKPKSDLVKVISYFSVAAIGLVVLGLTLHPLALALAGLPMGPLFPLFISFSGERFPLSLEKVTSLVIAFNSVFIVAMQLMVGTLSDHWGLTLALWVGPAFFVLSLFLLVVKQKALHETA